MAKLIDVDGEQAGFGSAFAGVPFPYYVKDDGRPLEPGDEGYDLIPRLDKHHVFDDLKYLRIILTTVRRAFDRTDGGNFCGILAIGDTGTGKTSTLRQVFARMGCPHLEYDWSPRTEAKDLITVRTLDRGGIVDEEQVLAQAVMNGWPITINEADCGDPGELLCLNSVFEDGILFLPSGETIHAKPGFFVNLTANNMGAGDEAGIYGGTRDQNAAVKRRFFKVKVPYASEEQEFDWLCKRFPDVAQSNSEGLRKTARLVTMVRKAFKGTLDGVRLPAPISRTEMARLVELMTEFAPIGHRIPVVPTAMAYIYTDGLPDEVEEPVMRLIEMSFGPDALSPEPAP